MQFPELYRRGGAASGGNARRFVSGSRMDTLCFDLFPASWPHPCERGQPDRRALAPLPPRSRPRPCPPARADSRVCLQRATHDRHAVAEPEHSPQPYVPVSFSLSKTRVAGRRPPLASRAYTPHQSPTTPDQDVPTKSPRAGAQDAAHQPLHQGAPQDDEEAHQCAPQKRTIRPLQRARHLEPTSA